MVDPDTTVQSILNQIIQDLDARKHGVAIAHLQDAIAALIAVQGGEVTEYALDAQLVDGKVAALPGRRQVR